jgi:AraC-like DNA-binding protein
MMSKTRHSGLSVRASAIGLSARFDWRPRPSPWGQLLWGHGGAFSVELPDGSWLVPPDRAIWIPPQTSHRLQVGGRLSLFALYWNARLSRDRSPLPMLVARSPLLVALCARIQACGGLDVRRARDRRLLAVLGDELRAAPRDALMPPLPRDARAVRAAEQLLLSPSEPLTRIARRSGASPRTLARRFREETGYGIAAWRRRAWLVRAAEQLVSGRAVTAVALAVGYDSPSAFVAAFKRATGMTPGAYAAR